jgi:hypothetical protein
MLVIQHNCRKAYAITIAALETGLQRQAAIVCLQEPYIGAKSYISHPGYTVYWPEAGEQSAKRVAIAIRRDLLAKMVIEVRSDLINHPYIQAIDIWDLHAETKSKIRRTRLINVYDNVIGPGSCWQGPFNYSRRAIEDIAWNTVIRGRVILLGDFNAHSPEWNPRETASRGAGPLETVVEDYNLILNNQPGVITRPGRGSRGSIIDLTFTTTEIGPLESWAIEEEFPTPSDHELILFEWLDPGYILNKAETPKGDITGWNIDNLIGDSEAKKIAKESWDYTVKDRAIIDYNSSKTDLEEEAIFIGNTLTRILNEHAKPVRITAYSKRWWTTEV